TPAERYVQHLMAMTGRMRHTPETSRTWLRVLGSVTDTLLTSTLTHLQDVCRTRERTTDSGDADNTTTSLAPGPSPAARPHRIRRIAMGTTGLRAGWRYLWRWRCCGAATPWPGRASRSAAKRERIWPPEPTPSAWARNMRRRRRGEVRTPNGARRRSPGRS